MKIVFLDIDGVLNSHQSDLYHNSFSQEFTMEKRLCPIATSNLKELLTIHPDIKIVVSSTWRRSRSIEQLGEILSYYKIDKNVVLSKTNYDGPGEIRGLKIKKWLQDNQHLDISHFVILDDDGDMDEFVNTHHFIQTNSKVGFDYLSLEKALVYFGNYLLSFNDLKAGEQYLLFSKPKDTIYTFDGSGFFYLDEEGQKHQNVFLYPETEKFALVKKKE